MYQANITQEVILNSQHGSIGSQSPGTSTFR